MGSDGAILGRGIYQVTQELGKVALWGRGSNQMTQEPGKVHMGSCGVEVRTNRCLMGDNEG